MRIRNQGIVQLGDLALDSFHNFYYDNSGRTWANTFYFGIKTLKFPLDLWIYQELIFRIKPDVIVETGTYKGGSALYLAHLCDAIGNGRVITIDKLASSKTIARRALSHPRIKFIRGSSVSPNIIKRVKKLIQPKDTVMVILDSDHSKKHVLAELQAYGKLVTKGSYMILEDTNINGHPVFPDFGPGPMEALEIFKRRNNKFISDAAAEKFFITFNPRGYLRRK